MAKIGRNDPCPCGTGKKYKKCCLAKDEAAAASARPSTLSPGHYPTTFVPPDWQDDLLDEESNRVLHLVHAEQLDEAEAAARDLLRKYPEVPDGLMRLAMVFEKRGDWKQAADYYRQTADFMDEHEGFEDALRISMRTAADELDPPQS